MDPLTQLLIQRHLAEGQEQPAPLAPPPQAQPLPTTLPTPTTHIPPKAQRWENAQQMQNAYRGDWTSPNPILLRASLGK